MTLDAIVVGGGQAGLAAGYWLDQRGLEFKILDAGSRVGQSWARRWDSLRLFTPARYSELPGLEFPRPAGADRFWRPSKDEMAAYLRGYAERFSLPVALDSRVEQLRREDDVYRVRTENGGELSGRAVIAATGAHQTQRVPSFAAELDPGIDRLGSTEYLRPAQIDADAVLVVGAGASGVDIAFDLAAAGREVVLAGPKLRHLPRRILGIDLYWWLHASGVIRARCDRPPGRWICDEGRRGGDELIGLRDRDFERAGIRRVGRVVGVRDGRPAIEGGELLDPGAVVWCIGLGYEFERWIELPVLDRQGIPIHDRGVVADEPGLYVLGLPYQSRPDSALVGGVGRDAERIVATMADRLGANGLPKG